MSKKIFVLLIVSIFIAALSLHFIVEGLGGVQDHLNDRQASGLLHSHDGDQFVLNESGVIKSVQLESHVFFISGIAQASRPLPPPFIPPKSL